VAYLRLIGEGEATGELAEEYAAVGRSADARDQARLAIPLLGRDDPGLPDRREHLDTLAAY